MLALLIGGLLCQVALHRTLDAAHGQATELPVAPPAALLDVAAFGERATLSRGLMLWLQSFESRTGHVAALTELDYARVETWLDRALRLDPRSDYPLLAASRIYADVPDPARQRRMLDFVHRAFLNEPALRWRWLAHAALMAKHRLHDPHLALTYARTLREHTTAGSVPGWARQMEVFVLEGLGEYEAAQVVLGALIAEGQLTDVNELAFLAKKLEELGTRIESGRQGP